MTDTNQNATAIIQSKIFDPMKVDYDPESKIMPSLTKAQFSRLSSDLNDKHALFYMFWQLGNIRFTTSISTAAVVFSKSGDSVDFVFNPEFWNSLNEYTRQFVICHECLHVTLKHGLRMKHTINPEAINVALDIVVNHSLVNKFGFHRYMILNWQNYCWVDTVFPGENIPDDRFAEYYIQQLRNRMQNTTCKTVDDHSSLGNSMDDADTDADGKPNDAKGKGKDKKNKGDKGDELLKKIDGLLSPDEKKKLKDFLSKGTEKGKDDKSNDIGSNSSVGEDDSNLVDANESMKGNPFSKAGTGKGGLIWNFPPDLGKARQSWVSLVKKWTNRNRHVIADSEQWVRVNRRSVLLPSDLFIPSEMESDDGDEKRRIKAWFFLDTSGSCISFRERFWRAAETVPRKYFDLELHTFDTDVYKVDMKNRQLRGGGGTSFSAIEQFIQIECKRRNMKYPEIICVITDGEGDFVAPEIPRRWNWIMPDGGQTHYCHKESFIYDLEAFE